MAIRGENALSSYNASTGEITLAYDSEGYPKPWENADKAPKGTNLDPDPSKYADADSPFNETYVAMNLDKFPAAAAKKRERDYTAALEGISNQRLLIRSIPQGSEREAAEQKLVQMKNDMSSRFDTKSSSNSAVATDVTSETNMF